MNSDAAPLLDRPARDLFDDHPACYSSVPPELIDRIPVLLRDRTSKKNIVWATDTYKDLGAGFRRDDEITPDNLLNKYDLLDSIRLQSRAMRTRKHGEVHTPLRICRQMCDDAHDILYKGDWREYVSATVLEIACGEAPFLASRRDLESGEFVPVADRVGLLDRKLRVAGENACAPEEWRQWAFVAFESTYAYEYQGDNLFRARANLFLTYGEYLRERWDAEPSPEDLDRLAKILSWNVWQMDGLTGAIPGAKLAKISQAALFAPAAPDSGRACVIRDWKEDKVLPFMSIRG
ncbi:MAG: hypothetical protein K2H64_01285 [Desulfovibrio sp.]|nr:hypothetical protein [Desulfovibrio sp.]